MVTQRLLLQPGKGLMTQLPYEEEQAFHTLYTFYWQKLFVFVYNIIRDTACAQDIVQDVFVSLWVRRHEVSIHTTLSRYLYTAVRYRAINHLEAIAVQHKKLEQVYWHYPLYDNSLQEQQAAQELQTIIHRQVNLLPARMKEVFLLSREECLSHREIAARLQITHTTVKKQVGYALKQIRAVTPNP